MKTILLAVLLSTGFVMASQAQCDKKLILSASKAIFLAADSSEERSEESAITIEITKTSIHIKHGEGPNDVIDGDIKDLVCEWKESLKNGKSSSSKVVFTNPNGESKNGKITVEGKAGVLTFWFELDEDQGRRIKVPIEKAKEE